MAQRKRKKRKAKKVKRAKTARRDGAVSTKSTSVGRRSTKKAGAKRATAAKKAARSPTRKSGAAPRGPASRGGAAYDESAIISLDPLAHIRLRTGMYIGRVGNGSHPHDGIYVMLKEVIDNSVDEFIMRHGKRIEIKRKGKTIAIRDYGRGIPLGKVVDCVSQINTGGKYNDEQYQFTVGLNGVGTKVVNALSSRFEVCSWRDGRFARANFAQGELDGQRKGKQSSVRNGTQTMFTPDEEIFGDYEWDETFIERRMRYYAYLNSGLTLIYNGTKYLSKNGLADLVSEELGEDAPVYDVAHYRGDRIEFAFTHTQSYGETYFSFVNGQYTNDGGTHQSAFREGVLKGINEFAGKSYAGEDVRDGILGAVAIRMKEPTFESQTKNKLGSTEVRGWIVKEVRENVMLWLHRHKKQAEAMIQKINANERIRKELSSIKKQARERAKKTAIRIPKLVDCKEHFHRVKDKRRDDTMIFLAEGDSAGGAMLQARDVYTQAIFSLKGKPLNTHNHKLDTVYKNEELYNIMRALGIEDGIDGLRYNRVVIATDADVDGMHIRNLLITYFLKFFEPLVAAGHLYVLETPLFRVRNKKETHYCYSEAQKRKAIRALEKGKGKAEVTRFKGLGEISPKEFKQFIGKNIRLTQIDLPSRGEIRKVLEFFMGKNTPARRKFIVRNLIIEDSDQFEPDAEEPVAGGAA